MDRKKIYPGQIPLETDLLETNRFALIGLGKLAEALFGRSTFVRGLDCTPTAPASMQVRVAPGEIYCPQNLDDTAYSSLPADIVHQIVKQGLLLDAVLLSCPAPTTVGMSVNYLIQAAFQEVDSHAVVLPYYNASNPPQAYSGPDNTGSAQSTVRQGVCTVLAKPGIAATSGAQQTPAADPGYVGLWIVAVAYGQVSITAANITQVVDAPFLPADGLAPHWHQVLPTKADKDAVATSLAALGRKIGAVPASTNLQAEVEGKADKHALDQSVATINQRISTETGKLLTLDAAKTYLPITKAAETYLTKEDAKTQYLAQANAETFVSEHAASRYAGIIALNGNSDFMDVAGNPPLPLNMGIGLSNFSTLYDASLIDVIPRPTDMQNPPPYPPDAEDLLQMVYGKPTREFSPAFRILKLTRKAVGVPSTFVFHIPNQHIVCATDISFCLYAKTTGAGEKKWGWGIGDTGGKWKQCVTHWAKRRNPLYYFHLDFYDESHSGGAVGDTLLLALPVVFNTLWPDGELHGKPYCPTDAAYRINRAIAAGTSTGQLGQ